MLNLNLSSDLGTVQQTHLSRSTSAEKIAVILQVYKDTERRIDATPIQENIRRICEQYVNAAGVRLVCVEHAETKLTAPPSDASLDDLVQYTSVSAAVQKLISDHPDNVEAWGVDNLELINLSYEAMNKLNNSKQRQGEFFKRLCEFLYKAQAKYYSSELAELRRGTINLYRAGKSKVNLPLNMRASLINKMAENINLNLQQFPVYYVFATNASLETSIDFERVKVQREKFMSKVTDRALSWCASVRAGNSEIDKEMTRMVIKLWMTTTNLNQQEMKFNLKLRGLTNVLKEASEWFETWLLNSAIKIRLTGKGFARQSEIDFYDMLAQLEQKQSSSILNLKDFHDYMLYRQNVDQGITPISLASEFRECERALIEKFDMPAVTQLSNIEEKLDHIYIALQAQQNPLDAELGDIAPGRLIGVLQDLFNLVDNGKIPRDLRDDVNFFDQLLYEADKFPRLSRQRGQLMIRRTLDLLRDRREDRALLVAGGFHQRAIIRELEKNRQVSWELVVPRINMDFLKQ